MLPGIPFGNEASVLFGYTGWAVLYVFLILLPARILQKRHDYSVAVLLLAFIPLFGPAWVVFLGPMLALWGFAFSTPKFERADI